MHTSEFWKRTLNLDPHPEGGYYKETFRSTDPCYTNQDRYSGSRRMATSIYFLLESDIFSAFHKLKSDEIWYFHAGSPTRVHCISPQGSHFELHIGHDPEKNQFPQIVIPKDHWFAAEVMEKDSYCLVGCQVSPGFEFSDFELAKRSDLLALFPEHHLLIHRFTR